LTLFEGSTNRTSANGQRTWDAHKSAHCSVDPDAEERRDQRIGNWVVVIAYGGSGLLILAGLVALAWLSR